MTRETWLEAAKAIRWAVGRLTYDPRSPHGFRSPPPVVSMWPPDVVACARFVHGGGEELPLHADMMTLFNPATMTGETAARICESLAYDGADGP